MLSILLGAVAAWAVSSPPGDHAVADNTCFQVAAPYRPELDIGSDVAIVYGVTETFQERVERWRAEGYETHMMTGIAWGGYAEYYGSGEAFKREEVQTRKNGELFMHHPGVGYNVPTPAYIEYIKRYIDPAIDAGVSAIHMEEPEFWVQSGWSAAFQAEWERFYGEPWQPPDSSVDAQYRASKLKYELYFNALREVFEHIKTRGAEQGRDIACIVPTHSLINYAHWRIVSPESRLMDLAHMDGYIAQVWTGTARSPNIYQGERKERTFETAFLEYGQMWNMVRPTGRKVWFLADPVEDNPNRSWNDYRYNYECTIVASLMWPEVHRFEVMPWPNRIFRGTYPPTDLDKEADLRAGIPADYATQILVIINALNDMAQEEVVYDTGTRGVGIAVSDTLMFQRAAPEASDAHLGHIYGLALPLLKAGLPIEPVQLENTIHPGALDHVEVLLLTYEGQKPLRPAYHEALAAWVRAGGGLLFAGDGSDPYHAVREWWNEQGTTDAKAFDDLSSRLGVDLRSETAAPVQVGAGHVMVLRDRPSELQQSAEGAARVRQAVAALLAAQGKQMETQHYLRMQRGPYVVATVMDESVSDAPLKLSGEYINLFDAQLPVVRELELNPNERTLLYDLSWARRQAPPGRVAAAGARIRGQVWDNGTLRFTARGPSGTTAVARVVLPGRPASVRITPEVEFEPHWDAASGTLWLRFPNQARELEFEISLE